MGTKTLINSNQRDVLSACARFVAVASLFAVFFLVSSFLFTPMASAAKKNYVTSIDAPSSVSLDAGQSKNVKVKVKAKGSAKQEIRIEGGSYSAEVLNIKAATVNDKGVIKLTLSAKKISSQRVEHVRIETIGTNKSGKHLITTIAVTVIPVAADSTSNGSAAESDQNIIGRFILLFIILAIIIIVAVIWFSVRHARRTFLSKNSTALSELPALNARYQEKFFFVITPGPYSLSVHSKQQFDHFDPDKNMFAIVREEEPLFQDLCSRLQSNQETYKEYESDAEGILSRSVPPDKLPFYFRSKEKYLDLENETFQSNKLQAICDVQVDLYWSYTSPQGQNHYDASRVYRKADLESILRDIAKATEYEQSTKYQRDLLTPSLRYEILKRDNYTCQICGRTQKDGAKLEVDHIIPVAKGGKTEPDNLQTLCWECNRGKSDKDM